ncbi:unnamed protein product [Pedinophyceae sp. YPF-701]|nr:unnamed protein product [Pedinophyceae sp. YPF-701]
MPSQPGDEAVGKAPPSASVPRRTNAASFNEQLVAPYKSPDDSEESLAPTKSGGHVTRFDGSSVLSPGALHGLRVAEKRSRRGSVDVSGRRGSDTSAPRGSSLHMRRVGPTAGSETVPSIAELGSAPEIEKEGLPAGSRDWRHRSCVLAWLANTAGLLLHAVRVRPLIVLWSILATCAVLAALLVPVLLVVDNQKANNMTEARSIATQEATDLTEVLTLFFAPTEALASIVAYGDLPNPDISLPQLPDLYDTVLRGGATQRVIANLQLAPDGIVAAVEPLEGNEAIIGFNIIDDERQRASALAQAASRRMSIVGPFQLQQGGFGGLARVPVRVRLTPANAARADIRVRADGTREASFAQPRVGRGGAWDAVCAKSAARVDAATGELAHAGAPCFNYWPVDEQENTVFWGFATALFLADQLLSQTTLSALPEAGMQYRLFRVFGDSEITIAQSDDFGGASVQVDVALPGGGVWFLQVAESDGDFQPGWWVPAVVAVVLVAVAAGLVTLCVLAGNVGHRELLCRMMPQRVIDAVRRRGEYREMFPAVVIMFADIVRYTQLSAQLSDASEVLSVLSELYSQFDTLCEIHGVFKLETIGDSYVAVAGAEPGQPDPADNLRRMVSLAMNISRVAESYRRPDGKPLQLRVGIHAGPVAAGVLGQKVPKFTLIGDAMNVAARMESSGLPGEIHVSDAVARVVPELVYDPQTAGAVPPMPWHLIKRLDAEGHPLFVKGKGYMQTYVVRFGEERGSGKEWLAVAAGENGDAVGSSVFTTSGVSRHAPNSAAIAALARTRAHSGDVRSASAAAMSRLRFGASAAVVNGIGAASGHVAAREESAAAEQRLTAEVRRHASHATPVPAAVRKAAASRSHVLEMGGDARKRSARRR